MMRCTMGYLYYVYSVRTTREREREMGRSKIDCIVIHNTLAGDALLHDLSKTIASSPERERSWLATTLILGDVEKDERGRLADDSQ